MKLATDGTLRVQIRRGDRSRPPLLLANGAGASLDVLDPFVEALDPDLEVVRFDPPGVGGSPNPARPYRFHSLIGALGAVLDAEGYGRFDMLGFSWGSALAQQMALFNPQRLRRLVLIAASTGTLMVPPLTPRLYATMATPRRFHDKAYARRIIGDAYGGSTRTDPDTTLGILYSGDQVHGWRGYYYQLTASAGWTSLPWLPLVRQHTLVLSGDDDPLIPVANGRLLRRLLPHARLEVYPGGHVSILTEAPMIAGHVSTFLREA